MARVNLYQLFNHFYREDSNRRNSFFRGKRHANRNVAFFKPMYFNGLLVGWPNNFRLVSWLNSPFVSSFNRRVLFLRHSNIGYSFTYPNIRYNIRDAIFSFDLDFIFRRLRTSVLSPKRQSADYG